MGGDVCLDSIEEILRSWLEEPELTIFCGHWNHGGIMELLPRGRAHLSGPRYDGPFAGLRELRLNDDAHHVHLDLGRLTRACYVLTPSVCYDFRPSFEVRLTSRGEDPLRCFGLGLALAHPYGGQGLRNEPVRRYFMRLVNHLRRYPEVVSFACGSEPDAKGAAVDWNAIDAVLADADFSLDAACQSVRRTLQQRSVLSEASAA